MNSDAFYRLNRPETRLLFAKRTVREAVSGKLKAAHAPSVFEKYLRESHRKHPRTKGSLKSQVSKFKRFIELGERRPSDAMSIFEDAFVVAARLSEAGSLKGSAHDMVLAVIRKQVRTLWRLSQNEMAQIMLC